MKRFLVIVLTPLLISSYLIHGAAAASPAAGSKCSKVGQTAISAGKTFTCVKTGRLLVWNKGVALKKPSVTPMPQSSPSPISSPAPTPVVSSSPTPTPTPTPQIKNQIPITLPVPITGSINFTNAAENYAQIPQVAWQRVQDVIAANPAVNIPTTIDIGPNTKADLGIITNSLNRLYKLFSGFDHFNSYFGIIYNAKDLSWAQVDASSLFKTQGIKGILTGTESIKQQSEAGCEINGTIAVNCYGGMALPFKDGGNNFGGAFYGVENTYTGGGQSRDFWTAAEKYAGPMTQVTHEGTHNYQFAQFFDTPFSAGQHTAADQSHTFTPWWFSEGQANGIGIPVFIDDYQSYLNVRSQTTNRKPDSRAKVPEFTPEGMKAFLMNYQSTGPDNYNWSLAYSIGYSAVEALIAIGGPQSTMALYALGGNGEDWSTAFQHVYGITWDQGATVIGKVLAAEYTAKPLGN